MRGPLPKIMGWAMMALGVAMVVVAIGVRAGTSSGVVLLAGIGFIVAGMSAARLSF